MCENNEYSIFSHISERQAKKRKIYKIARSLGVESVNLNGNSIEEVFLKSKKIINKIKKNPKPYLIEFNTFRNIEHCGPNNDDNLDYRDKKYLNFWKNKCPVNNYERKLLKSPQFSLDIKESFKKEIALEISKSFSFAKKSKFPQKKILKKYVYA